ncbi:hypothetical protein B0I21_101474 [Sphingobacterium paludis]|uniref:DUF6850 domain-containing protein n=2 Tax=Sphingobacterium paludis TaxID=1476465 RepID=A0A4R7D8K8_9SPHI|nr:hypothetical protein B0I21_101474 [Sphingobacterium paludis]
MRGSEVRAQSTAIDSLSHAAYAQSYSWQQLYHFAVLNKVWLKDEVKNNFNRLDADAYLAKGNWIDAQGATQLRALELSTQGKTNVGGFSVWGKFNYYRAMEDSTRLRHQTRMHTDAPVYFGSLKNNYYERNIYSMEAIVQYCFDRQRLPMTVGVDYRVGNHFSNNDPRGRVADFQFDLSAAVGRVFPNGDIHVNFLYGYGRERVGVGYKNDKYANNTADPLYINYYMNGFGRAKDQVRDIRYNDDFIRYGTDFLFSREVFTDHKVFAKAGWRYEQQFFKFYDSSPLTYTPLNKYKRNAYDLDVLLKTSASDASPRVYRLHAGVVDGRDYNYEIAQNNYVYRKETLLLEASDRFKNISIKAALGYESTASEDGSVAISLAYKSLKPALEINQQIPLAVKAAIIPRICLSYNHVLDSEFSLPSVFIPTFTQTIMQHNHLYYTTSSYRVGAGLDYQLNNVQFGNVVLGVYADYWQPSTKVNGTNYIAIPGDDRFQAGVRITAFF